MEICWPKQIRFLLDCLPFHFSDVIRIRLLQKDTLWRWRPKPKFATSLHAIDIFIVRVRSGVSTFSRNSCWYSMYSSRNIFTRNSSLVFSMKYLQQRADIASYLTYFKKERVQYSFKDNFSSSILTKLTLCV